MSLPNAKLKHQVTGVSLGPFLSHPKCWVFNKWGDPGCDLAKISHPEGQRKTHENWNMTHGSTLNMEANDSCDMNKNPGKSRGQASQTFYARSDQNRWFKHIVSSFFVPHLAASTLNNSLHHPQPHPKCVTPRKKATQIAFYKLQQQNKTN